METEHMINMTYESKHQSNKPIELFLIPASAPRLV